MTKKIDKLRKDHEKFLLKMGVHPKQIRERKKLVVKEKFVWRDKPSTNTLNTYREIQHTLWDNKND